MSGPYHHLPGMHPVGLVYGTQPGTYIDVERRLLVTHTHRGELGSWFTFRACREQYGFPHDGDARSREAWQTYRVGVAGRLA